ncbi:MAG TPA: diguanylate cyclase [Kofleriaceae bacterium]|jgi:diguanylate cyclase (GGDEF)-like protein/PAS domain S-box-containing protein
MRGSRVLGAAVAVFVAGLAAVAYGLNRYDDAYAWVAHTSDVRLAIGRAVGHAGAALTCDRLRGDFGALRELTSDNPIQQVRLPALYGSIEDVCAGRPALELVDQLSGLDATERALMEARRGRLATLRVWSLLSFTIATLAACTALLIARLLQRRASRDLVASEDRFRMLAASSTDLIRIHDATGRPIYVSPSCERLLGYTPDELLAAEPLSLGHPDDLDRMHATLEGVRTQNVPASTLVYRLRAKDGAYRWFETHTNPIRDDDGNLLRFYTSARDITERVELEQKLEVSAVTDELTGLLNRRGFMMLAGQEHRIASRQQLGVAVVFADLDGLKLINDKLGHEHGDRAIRALGEIMRVTFRESDVVARLGGDEFAALAYNVDRPRIEIVLERFRAAIAAAQPIGSMALAASLGVALLAPGEQRSLDDLVADADQRMYETKRARKASKAS